MIKYLINNPINNAIKRVRSILDPDQKRGALVMILLLVINAIFDFAGLMTIGMLIISALKNDIFVGEEYIRGVDEENINYFFNSNLRSLYDFSGAENHISFLFYLSIIIFIVFIIKNAVGIYIVYLQSKFSYSVALRLNMKMFKYFYDQGYLFIKDSTSGKKVYTIVDIPMRFASHYLNNLMMFWTEFVVILIIAVALMFYDPTAVLLLGATILPTFYAIYAFSKNRIRDLGIRRNKLAPTNYAKVFETMNGYVDIKLSNNENNASNEYESLQKELNRQDAIHHGIYNKLNQRTNDIIFGMGILVIFGYAHFSKLSTEQVLSLLGLFALAAYKFLPSINRMLNGILQMKNVNYVFSELSSISNTGLEKFPLANKVSFTDKLEIKDLSYKYPQSQNLVLNKLNFEIEKGKTIGFVGSSGSGKTTLLKVLLRLLEQTEGEIRVDNTLVDTAFKPSYQKIIGYVEQEIFILNDTILKNVAFGQEDPDVEKAWQSLKEAQLENFVKEHGDGLDMMLGENGVNLSGGQKQRIGIARALYKDSEILMFDEATSALDSMTEKAVVESINHLSNLGKTVLIVAHRISTLEKCDRIYKLKDGQIDGEYSYEQLISSDIYEMEKNT